MIPVSSCRSTPRGACSSAGSPRDSAVSPRDSAASPRDSAGSSRYEAAPSRYETAPSRYEPAPSRAPRSVLLYELTGILIRTRFSIIQYLV